MGIFLDNSRAANSTVGGPIRPKFKLVQAFMHVIITCKYEKEQMKKEAEKKWRHRFFIITLSVTMESGQISNSSKLSCMLSLSESMKRIRSRKAEKKWRHRFSHYKPMGIFSDAHGQLTPQSVVQSGRNSNSSELSCMSSLPASMKRIG